MTQPHPLSYINVGPGGTFRRSGKIHTAPADVDAIVEHIRAQRIVKVALYFHGGLNSEDKGIEVAESMRTLFEAAGAHPISFVWETGFGETLRDKLSTIHQTRLFRKTLAYALRWAAAKLGLQLAGRGAGAPLPLQLVEERIAAGDDFAELDAAGGMRGGEALEDEDLAALEAELTVELQTDFESDPEMPALLAPAPPGARGIGFVGGALFIARIVVAVVKRRVQGRDHGVYTTIVEEVLRRTFNLADLGALVWSGMKEKARAMWASNEGLDGEDLHAGRYLLEKLTALQQERPELAIDLIGHSAGSVAICELLQAAADLGAQPALRNVLFLAPAARLDLFEQAVMKNPQLYQQFRMFTMADASEKEDPLLAPIYRRSLLYLVSGCFEEEVDAEICGMERFFLDPPPFHSPAGRQLRAFLHEPNRRRLVLGPTQPDAPPDSRSDARHHGDFDEDADTRASLRLIVGA